MSNESKSSESIEAILKQIREFTENDSSSSTPIENVNGLIEDISITSSPSAQTPNENSSVLGANLNSGSDDVDPDLQFFLMKISKMTDHEIDNLDDAAKEFRNMKFINNKEFNNNEDQQFDYSDFIQQFNNRFNVATSSLDEVMDMIEIMQENRAHSNSVPNNKTTNYDFLENNNNDNINNNNNDNDFKEYFQDENFEFQNELSDDSLKEHERKINDLIQQQNKRNSPILNKRTSDSNFQSNISDRQNKSSSSIRTPNNSSLTQKNISFDHSNSGNKSFQSQLQERAEKEGEDVEGKEEEEEELVKPKLSRKYSGSQNSMLNGKKSSTSIISTEAQEEEGDNEVQQSPIPKMSKSLTVSSADSGTKNGDYSSATKGSNKNRSKNDSSNINSSKQLSINSGRSNHSKTAGNEEESYLNSSYSHPTKRSSSNSATKQNSSLLSHQSSSQSNQSSQKHSSQKHSSIDRNNRNNSAGNATTPSRHSNIDANSIHSNKNSRSSQNRSQNNSMSGGLSHHSIPEIEIEEEEEENELFKSFPSKSDSIINSNSITSNNNTKKRSSSSSSSSHVNISNQELKNLMMNSFNGEEDEEETKLHSSETFDRVEGDLFSQNASESKKSPKLNSFNNKNNKNNSSKNIINGNSYEELHNNSGDNSYAPQISKKFSAKPKSHSFIQQDPFFKNYDKHDKSSTSLNKNKSNITNSSYSSNHKSPNQQEFMAIERQNGDLRNRNHSLKTENSFLRQRLAELEAENEQLKFNLLNSEEKVSSLEHQNEKTQSQLNLKNDQIDHLNLAKENLQKAYSGIEDMLKTQIADSAKLTQQRERLVELLQMQSKLCQDYDQKLEQLNHEKVINRIVSMRQPQTMQTETVPIIQPRVQQDNTDLLAAIAKTASEINVSYFNFSFANEITQIKDSSNIPVNSRIISIVNCLCSRVRSCLNEVEVKNGQKDEVKDQINRLENQNLQILQVLEGELRFLQKLSHSNDLQNVVFYRPSQGKALPLDKESQSELIRHCVVVQKFIDDTIGFYSQEQVQTLTKNFENTDAQRIFSLMHTDEFEKTIKYLLSFIQAENTTQVSSSNDFRQIVDVFFAQSIMNEILQNHIVDIQSQIVYASHQNQKLQMMIKEQDENKLAIDDANKVIRHLQRKETKLQKVISKIIPNNSQCSKDITNAVNAFVNEYKSVSEQLEEKKNSIETVSQGIEELKKNLCQKVSKRNKTIKALKKIVSSQKVQILNAQKQKEEEIEKILVGIKDKDQEIEVFKNRLFELETVRDNLQSLVDKLKDEHQSQLNEIKNEYNYRMSSYEQSYESSSKERETISLLSKEKNLLQNKISADQKSFKRTVQDLQNQTLKFRSQYEQLALDVKTLRIENEKLLSDKQQLNMQQEQLKSELDTSNISKRALEIKLKTAEENFENEKRTLQSQLTAKMTSLQTELQNQFKDDQGKQTQQIRQIYELSSKYLNFNDINSNNYNNYSNNNNDNYYNNDNVDINDNINDINNKNNGFNIDSVLIVRSLCQIIEDLTKSKEHYYAVINDVLSTQDMLSLPPESSIADSVSSLLNELREKETQMSDIYRGEKDARDKLDKVSHELSCLQSQVSTSNQWEVWARRINGIVNDSHCTTFSPEQLRLSLEESILASVSQRTLIYRIRTLREEKKAFLKFNKPILTERSMAQPTWGVLVSIYISIKRIQQMAGCVPMHVGQSAPSIVEESQMSMKKRHNKSKKDNVKHQKKGGKLPIRPFVNRI